jgi:hypothetical protein
VTTLRSYLSAVLIAFDLFCNVVICGRWYTISSRAMLGKVRGNFWWSLLYRALNKIQPGHCEDALRGDIARSEESLRDLRGPPVT